MNIEFNELIIEDDVWIAHGAIITPSVKFIGRGSIIATGSVVTKDVDRYAVLGGVPAKVLRYRFDDKTIQFIEKSEWWKKSKNELKKDFINRREFYEKPIKQSQKNRRLLTMA